MTSRKTLRNIQFNLKWIKSIKNNIILNIQNSYLSKFLNSILLVPRNFSRGRGVIPSLVEWGGAVSSADVSVGTTSLECSVLECGQVYRTLCC
jgi:hypothetical protein